ncbi:MAG: hypothetical protein U0S48_16670 [Solirubrobacteraceae bacterium]
MSMRARITGVAPDVGVCSAAAEAIAVRFGVSLRVTSRAVPVSGLAMFMAS